MVSRPLMLASLLGASVGVPYAVSHTNQASTSSPVAAAPAVTAPAPPTVSWSPWASTSAPSATAPTLTSPPAGFSSTPIAAPNVSAAPPIYPSTPLPASAYSVGSAPVAYANSGAPPQPMVVRFHQIPEVLRFDVTKEWVYQNWDRKSTGLGDPELFGVRVALITGVLPSDLAGSLTYLFDNTGQCQHISFRGRTANTAQLVQFLMQYYQFQRMEAPAGEQLYQVRDGQEVYSELRTSPESVLLASAPNGSYGVVLELGRPGTNRPLVSQAPKLQIPPGAGPPAEAAKAAESGASDAPIYGKLRPATQLEHNQALERRYPN